MANNSFIDFRSIVDGLKSADGTPRSGVDVIRLLEKERPRDDWRPLRPRQVKERTSDDSFQGRLDATIEKAKKTLLDMQETEGYWVGEDEANISLSAQTILCWRYLGLSFPEKERMLVNYMKSTQGADGGWPIYYGGPGDIHATVEAYFAAKLTGVSPEADWMTRAREFILAHGGVSATRYMTKIYLALFDQYPWQGTPSMPPSIMFLPSGMPFNIYEMSYWARTCVVPLLILCEKKKVCQVPDECGIDELYTIPRDKVDLSKEHEAPLISWKNFFIQADRLLKVLEGSPITFHRRWAMKKAEKWILERQDVNGQWGGIFPATSHSIMALHALGHDVNHPAIQKGLDGLEELEIQEEDTLRVQPCVSPVWDTAWSVIALTDSGMDGRTPEIRAATDWLIKKQITKPGDWIVKARGVPAGGWAFQFHNDYYPDTDDSSVVLLALLNAGRQAENVAKAFDRGVKWLIGLQNEDGGYGAFEREVNDPIFDEILFNDDKNMLDPSTVDVTGRVIELLGRLGVPLSSEVIKRARTFIRSEQEGDGKWWGRWGVNYIYGTWSVLAGLRALGDDRDLPLMAKGADWLKSVQNRDGGWGESCRSYDSEAWAARGESTASQTAWAIMGLLAAGEGESESVRRGVEYLLEHQGDDGNWEEPEFTGTGFPRAFYLKYHMYRLYFPLIALGRYRSMLKSTT